MRVLLDLIIALNNSLRTSLSYRDALSCEAVPVAYGAQGLTTVKLNKSISQLSHITYPKHTKV